jgi:hypothetical protein
MKIGELSNDELAALLHDTVSSEWDDTSQSDGTTSDCSYGSSDVTAMVAPDAAAQLAAVRRRIRSSKVHKSHAHLACKVVWKGSGTARTQASESPTSMISRGASRGLPREIIREQRKIRNRESALRYRERRQMELDMLYLRIAELERESSALRERLRQYEPVNVIDTSVSGHNIDNRFTARITAIL